jgi:hypothetical protein
LGSILKEHWKHIISESSCPVESDLELYAQGKLPEEKRFAIEEHLTNCALCNDYLEGFSLLPQTLDLNKVEKGLKQELAAMLTKKQKSRTIPLMYRRLAFAASILLVIGLAIFFTQTGKQVHRELTEDRTLPIKDEAVEPIEESTIISEPAAIDSPKVVQLAQHKVPVPIVVEIHEDANYEEFEFEASEPIEMLSMIITADDKQEASVDMASEVAYRAESKLIEKSIAQGVVSDESGQALMGIMVYNLSNSKGTVTDMDGEFEISAKPGDSLQISLIGYETAKRVVSEDQNLQIAMQPSALALEEVIVRSQPVRKLNSSSASTTKSVVADNIWVKIKADAEKNLGRREREASIQNLEKLLSLTYKTEKQDTIQQAIQHVEAGKYRKAKRLIHELRE